MPYKTVQCIQEYEKVLSEITVYDVEQLVTLLDFSEDNMTAVCGIAGKPQ